MANQERDLISAKLLHHRSNGLKRSEPLSPPIVNSTVFHLPSTPDGPYQYARFGTPTWQAVEDQLSILENAPCVAFPSGMAAISAAFFATVKPGDKIVIPSDGYFATRSFAQECLVPTGVIVEEIPTLSYEAHDFDGVDIVYIETPSNPGLDVCDIVTVTKAARKAGAVTITDNTTMTPYLQRPLDLGSDIVVAADTKAPGGHSDVLFGHVATRCEKTLEKLKQWRTLSGSVPGPFEAWVLHRGLETLELRLERMCNSALTIAERLQNHPMLTMVRYPGLIDDPSYRHSKAQMSGFGFLIGLAFETATHADQFLGRCPYIAETTSFGGLHTSGERRARWGEDVADGFVRLSIGCEPTETLWDAISEALPSK